MPMQSFDQLKLSSELRKALKSLKFTEPTPVQKAVFEKAMDGGDLMVSAETGSGKTGAYGIPLVARLIEDSTKNALVLAPTRELAFQIEAFLNSLTSYCKNMQVTSLVGGVDIRRQFRALSRKPRVIVATPGRLIDHLKRKSNLLKFTKVLVLDEGDRMLDMGFSPQLKKIAEYLPSERQTSLFSATLPKKVQALAAEYLQDPKSISVGKTSSPVSSIKQTMISLNKKDNKEDRLESELQNREGSVIVFSRTKRKAESLAISLRKKGHAVGYIHGDCRQSQRDKTIRSFKKGQIRILSATDIAARGIDVAQVGHVINYDLPMHGDDYVHRIGRTARNGASGEALSFVMADEARAWNQLVRRYKIEGDLLLPEGKGRPSGKRPRRRKKKQFRNSRSAEGSNSGKSFRKTRRKPRKAASF